MCFFERKNINFQILVSVSEIVEQSEFDGESMVDGNGDEEREPNGTCQKTTNPLFDPDISQNESSQLNEEDVSQIEYKLC
jgi:hypothetical protein